MSQQTRSPQFVSPPSSAKSHAALIYRIMAGCGIFLGTAVGAFALAAVLYNLSDQYLPPEQIEPVFIRTYTSLPWLLPVILGLLLVFRVPNHRWLGGMVVLGGLFGYAVYYNIFNFFIQRPLYAGPPNAAGSLQFAVPQPTPGVELRLSEADAETLNRNRNGWKWRQLGYVPSHEPSTGPMVVSVNPIDDETWGAAALSLRGHCNLILVVNLPPPRQGGYVLYGILPDGAPCVGSAANRDTATSRDSRVWRE